MDGPNVAYTKQNFEGGKFSYRQVELVVDKLRERGGRILVVLPFAYTMRRIPNSINGEFELLTEDDEVSEQ